VLFSTFSHIKALSLNQCDEKSMWINREKCEIILIVRMNDGNRNQILGQKMNNGSLSRPWIGLHSGTNRAKKKGLHDAELPYYVMPMLFET